MPIERVTGLLVTVERDVEAKMRNGTVLRSDVYRSDSAAEHLVLLMRCPYDKRWTTTVVPSPNIGQRARHRHGSTPRRRADGAPAFGNARQRARLGLGASGLRVPTAAQRRCLSDVLRRFDGSGKISPPRLRVVDPGGTSVNLQEGSCVPDTGTRSASRS